MSDIKRKARAVWTGDLRTGKGIIDADSGVLKQVSYSFATRFMNETGTNPEELIAAAHAACYSMAFANTLSNEGYQPNKIETRATCIMSKQENGFRITRMQLEVRGQVPDMDEATFKRIAKKADEECPVSNLLRNCLKIELSASLV